MIKKSKVVQKGIGSIFLFLIVFLCLLLLKSAAWFLDNFAGVSFSIVVYQLFSPMKGTGAGIFEDYCHSCLYHSISLSLLFLVVYRIYDMLLGVLVLEFDVRMGKKEIHFQIGNRFRLISERLVLGAGFVISCILIWQRAVSVGIPSWVKSITHTSEIYEKEYVDPGEVSITFPEKKRNLLLIYMESMEATYASTEEGGGKPDNYIPGLTRLAEDNMSFSNDDDLGGAKGCADTSWTMGGLLASSSGVSYKVPGDGNDAGEHEWFLPGLTTIGDILEAAGYQNYFMCGSDAAFGGRLDFFNQHGDYDILDYYGAIEAGVIPEDYYVFWGMEDKYLYEYAKRELAEIANKDEPFNFTMLTVDTHHPDGYVCELCGDEYPEQYSNVIACADRQVCQFLEWVQTQDWYENTTVIITGDHCSMKTDFWDDIGDYSRTIYNCFINLPDSLTAEQTTNREFSILDMFPTILTAMGAEIEGEKLGLGTNLFSEELTLPEKMGWSAMNEELKLYSDYYYSNFIIGDR